MYEISVIGTILLMIVSAVDYARRTWIREINPVPATWILMMTMMSLSFWMYWVSPRKSWTANIGVTAGVLDIAIILIGVIASNIRYGTLKVAFDATQKRCLAGGAGVVVFWAITDQPLVSYSLVQCIALIGYIATIKRLLKAEKTTEPIIFWIAILLAVICAIYPAWVRNDPFSWIYIGRALPSTVLVIYLIARIKKRMNQKTEE
ncbi:MAG: hypothetical protein Q8Q90_01075 [bacterium]|nr:hypothetical protein [bacterium]